MDVTSNNRDERHAGTAQRVLRDFGTNGLRLFAECARNNAERRYWNGQVEFAHWHIDRALAYERLLDEVTRGTLRGFDI